jgi:hypothetical protein
MNAKEIRATVIYIKDSGTEPALEACAFFLREIAAQMAERNEHTRARTEKKQVLKEHKTSVRSAARRSSTTKRFFVEHWMLEAEATMLPPFQPGPDQKPIEDLAVGEITHGTLGTFANATITRRQ